MRTITALLVLIFATTLSATEYHPPLFFPPSGPATGSSIDLHPKSKFLQSPPSQ